MIKYILEKIGLAPIFFSPEEKRLHKKGLLLLIHLGLEGINKVDTDPKEGLCPLRLLHSL